MSPIVLLIIGFLPVLSSSFSASAGDYDFSKFEECRFGEKSLLTPFVAVPKLARQFTLRVEGKLNTDQFFDSVGYYHADLNWGATYIQSNAKQSAFLYDLNEGQAFEITDGKCEPKAVFDHACNTYALFIAETAAYSNVSGPCDISGGPIYYDGRLPDNETVRGIPTRRWRQCVRDNKQNMTYFSQYYYSADGISTPFNVFTPLRFETKVLDSSPGKEPIGTKYVYDFTSYQPNIEDESALLPPPGVYCPNWSNGRVKKQLPMLADEFSLTLSTFSKKNRQEYSTNISVDYANQLIALTTDAPSTNVHDTNGTTRRRVVHDYSTKRSFAMPMDDWNACTITAFNNNTTNNNLAHPADSQLYQALFDWQTPGWEYIGQRDFNSVPADVWINHFNSTNVTTEIYWRNQTSRMMENNARLVGIITYLKDSAGQNSDILTSSVSVYRTTGQSDWHTFDVASCLRSDTQEHAQFEVNIRDATRYAAADDKVAFITGIRNALANLTETTAIRFTDFEILDGSGNNGAVMVSTSILDWIERTPCQPSATVVLYKLHASLARKDFSWEISYDGKSQHVTFRKGSVRRADRHSMHAIHLDPNLALTFVSLQHEE